MPTSGSYEQRSFGMLLSDDFAKVWNARIGCCFDGFLSSDIGLKGPFSREYPYALTERCYGDDLNTCYERGFLCIL